MYVIVRSKKHGGPKNEPMRAEAVSVTQFGWLVNCAVTSLPKPKALKVTWTYWAQLHKSISPFLFLSLLPLFLFLFLPLWHPSRRPVSVQGGLTARNGHMTSR